MINVNTIVLNVDLLTSLAQSVWRKYSNEVPAVWTKPVVEFTSSSCYSVIMTTQFLHLICFFSQELFKILGVRDFLPSNVLTRWLADFVCAKKDIDSFCSDIIFILAGFDKAQLNEVSIKPYIYFHSTDVMADYKISATKIAIRF